FAGLSFRFRLRLRFLARLALDRDGRFRFGARLALAFRSGFGYFARAARLLLQLPDLRPGPLRFLCPYLALHFFARPALLLLPPCALGVRLAPWLRPPCGRGPRRTLSPWLPRGPSWLIPYGPGLRNRRLRRAIGRDFRLPPWRAPLLRPSRAPARPPLRRLSLAPRLPRAPCARPPGAF